MSRTVEPKRIAAVQGDDLGINLKDLRARLLALRSKQPNNVQQYLSDLAVVMAMPEGMRLLWVLLSRLGMFTPCYKGNADTYYLLGRHEAAQALFQDMSEADPIRAVRMLVLTNLAQKPEQGDVTHESAHE